LSLFCVGDSLPAFLKQAAAVLIGPVVARTLLSFLATISQLSAIR